MKIAINVVCLFLVLTMTCSNGKTQNTSKQGDNMKDPFRFEIAIGRVGGINANLFVDVKSNRNKLILKPDEEHEEIWQGRRSIEREVVIVYKGKVLSSKASVDGFDLSQAVIVSFEGDKIRVLVCQLMAAVFFERVKE